MRVAASTTFPAPPRTYWTLTPSTLHCPSQCGLPILFFRLLTSSCSTVHWMIEEGRGRREKISSLHVGLAAQSPLFRRVRESSLEELPHWVWELGGEIEFHPDSDLIICLRPPFLGATGSITRGQLTLSGARYRSSGPGEYSGCSRSPERETHSSLQDSEQSEEGVQREATSPSAGPEGPLPCSASPECPMETTVVCATVVPNDCGPDLDTHTAAVTAATESAGCLNSTLHEMSTESPHPIVTDTTTQSLCHTA